MSPVMYKIFVLSLFVAIVAGQMTQAMRDRILSDHNEKRRQATNAANMIELRYDMVLEQVAQAYLNRGCAGGFQHNPNRGCEYKSRGGTNGGTGTCASVGENWYSGYTDNTQGVDVVIGGAVAQWTDGRCSSWASPPLRCNSYWCSEKQNFYQTGSDSYGSCTQTSGQVLHYTQTMWATTTHVGCGYTAQCGTLCDYAMSGNVNLPSMGQMREANLWKIGTPCTSCPSGYTRCNNGLCSATTSTVTQAPTQCLGDTSSKPTNGNIGNCGYNTAIGSYCTQTCNSGYTLTSGSLSRQCKSGGVWASTTAVCSAVTQAPTQCLGDTSSKPTNGNIGNCGYNTAIGSYCTQTCNSGYTLTSGSLSRQCKSGGVWASTTAVCSAVAPTQCLGDTSSKPTNGNIGNCGSNTAIGSYCTQACNSGYTVTSGSLSRQCQSGGVWASTTAVCSAIYTNPPATQAPSTGSYCTSGPQQTQDTEIGAVSLIGDGNSIRDNSGCPGNVGPLDLTYLSTTLSRGSQYTLTLDRTTCGDYFVALIGAWIDWDQDKTWESSELLFPFSDKIGTVSFTFTVPASARLGSTRMRLQAQEIGSTSTTSINPCAMFNWGDTKDYSIYVTAGAAALNAADRVAVPADHICIPDGTAPVNGGQGSCSGVMLLGQTCTQTCDNGLLAGSLDRECTLDGYTNSTAVCV